MKKDCTIRSAKTKALISFAVTAKLICAFVFAHADCWFSHAVAQLSVAGIIQTCFLNNVKFKLTTLRNAQCTDCMAYFFSFSVI